MKARLLIVMTFALLFTTGCKSNQEKELTMAEVINNRLNNLSLDSYEINNIPEWLKIKINEIETTYAQDTNIVKIKINTCQWNGRVVFFIRNSLSSCVFCDVYYDDGSKIIFENLNKTNEFIAYSENWKLIYVFGNGFD